MDVGHEGGCAGTAGLGCALIRHDSISLERLIRLPAVGLGACMPMETLVCTAAAAGARGGVRGPYEGRGSDCGEGEAMP